MIFEEEIREMAAEEVADDPLWDDVLEVLGEDDVRADEGPRCPAVRGRAGRLVAGRLESV